MSAPWVPPHPIYHLRIFVVCLMLVVMCLIGFLFGVRMEALAPATGIITAREKQEIRTTISGLVEPGWYEGEIDSLPVRLNDQGDGLTEKGGIVQQYRLKDSRRLPPPLPTPKLGEGGGLRFHRLQAGDELWPGQVLAMIRADELRFRLRELESRDEETGSPGRDRSRREKTWLQQQLEQTVVRLPAGGDLWLTLEVRAAQHQAVQAGDVIVAVVPIDPATRLPRNLIARLQVDEKHFAEIKPEQSVRIYSNMHNHRLHGHAEAKIERFEPLGEPASGNGRCFHALAPITEAPFSLPLGSSFKAEIVVGRKTVYRLILEH